MHPGRGLRGPAHGQLAHGLRQLQPAVLPRRRDHARAHEKSRGRGRARALADRADVQAPGLGRLHRLLGHGARDRERAGGQSLERARHRRRRPQAIGPRPGRCWQQRKPGARRPARGPRARAPRRLCDPARGLQDLPDPGHADFARRDARRAALRPARPHPPRGRARRDHPARDGALLGRRRAGGACRAHGVVALRSRRDRLESGSGRRAPLVVVGRAIARDRLVGQLVGLPQARRLPGG